LPQLSDGVIVVLIRLIQGRRPQEARRLEIERSEIMAHESGEETEKPESGRVPGLSLQPGLAEGTNRPLKVKPSEPDDEHGGLPSRSLRDPYPRIPELYYG
jgi:hypothetical protein